MAVEITADVESDVACKAGIPGNIHNTENTQPALSSLQYNTDQDKPKEDELVLDINKARIIDKALGIYYGRMKQDNYYDSSNQTKGIFLKYFEEHNYDINDIEEELCQLPDDINGANAANNCSYLQFPMFTDFPMTKKVENMNEKRMEQFKILQHCLEFGVPPFEPQQMATNILLIHGFIKQCIKNNEYVLSPLLEQCIFLFYVDTELHWQKRMIYRERINKILTRWQDWNKMEAISCILADFLWLGDEDCACDVTTLEALGINYVLNCAGYDCQHVDYPKYFRVHWLFAADADHYNIIQTDVDSCIQFISECIESNGKILIHCYAGMNRSATITVAALMYFKGMDLFQAVKYTQSRRGWILGNQSFQRQLIQYAADLDLLIE